MQKTVVYGAQQSPRTNDWLTVVKRRAWLVVYGLITLPFTLFWLLVVSFFALVRPLLNLDHLPAARYFDKLFGRSQRYRACFSHVATLDGNQRWIGEATVAGEGRDAFRLILSLPIDLRWLPPRADECGKPDCLVSEGKLAFSSESDAEPNLFRLDPNGHQDLWKEDEWNIAASFLIEKTDHGRRSVSVEDIREAIELIDRQRGSTQPQFAGVGSR